jgi:hypothetical protein
MGRISCPYCKKKVKTEVGLSKHIQTSEYCKSVRKSMETMGGMDADLYAQVLQKGLDSLHLDKRGKSLPSKQCRNSNTMEDDAQHQEVMNSDSDNENEVLTGLGSDGEEDEYLFDPLAETTSEEGTTDDEASGDANGDDGETDEEGGGVLLPIDPNLVRQSKISGQQMKKYVRNAYANYAPLNETEQSAIRLMHKLIKKRATLDTYNDVMLWHLRESKKLGRYEPLGKTKYFISRDKLMKKLRKRYNMDKKYAMPRTLLLPHTKSKVVIWKKLARDNVMSLLTDPRWKDHDWLYFEDDPFAPPPDHCPFVEDLNTGEAFRVTYKKLITKPKQILVAIPLYIDGAVTGQYDKLQVTALKMSIGILNRYARDKEYAWKTLGYVSNYNKEDSRGKKIFVESGHVAAFDLYADLSDEDNEGANAAAETDVDKASDYHAILSVILESLFQLIKEGMVVDIFYKGKLYKDCELVFFVPFVKCDGDEGDKLCLSYRSRGEHVKQLCRYCQCPNDDTDNPFAEWPFKRETMLKRLFEQNNAQRLKELSQICTKNAFHGLRFGLHNDRGIHGACPWELLHAILLGIFKYTRDCFFVQMGKTSATAVEINSLAVMYGSLFARQSDRNKPRTKFGKGILKGKLMAKEFTGVLLVMAAILRSTAGRAILKSARKRNYKEEWLIRDWTLLVETLLQWEAYLNLPQMEKKHLQRLKRKHKFLMYLLKKVGNRTEGMGFKVMKFHAILHLAFDILMFCVPMVVDTGSNESHHKTTKVAAKLTQKDIKTFEQQTSNRMDDFHVLDLAMEELDERPLWEYYGGFYHQDVPIVEVKNKTGGMIINVFVKVDQPQLVLAKVVTRMQNKDKLVFDQDFLKYAHAIQEDIADMVPRMPICAEHSRGGQIFRSHPNYRGKGPWRDWVMIEWDTGDYPAQIWGFVDLSTLPVGAMLFLRDGQALEKGVYAIVESCDWIPEEIPGSDLFRPLMLETISLSQDGDVQERKFYLVDVETFKQPIAVVPDIGAKPKCQYLMMYPRVQWAQDFTAWIDMPHATDEQEMALPLDEQEPPGSEDEDSSQ